MKDFESGTRNNRDIFQDFNTQKQSNEIAFGIHLLMSCSVKIASHIAQVRTN